MLIPCGKAVNRAAVRDKLNPAFSRITGDSEAFRRPWARKVDKSREVVPGFRKLAFAAYF